MRIFLAGHPTVMLNKGGPSFKIKAMKKALTNLGVEVNYLDYWNDKLKLGEKDLVHIFNASIATYSLAKNLTAYGAKYVVNPIFYSRHTAKVLNLYQNMEKLLRKIFIRSYSDYYFTKSICEGAEYILPNTAAEGKLLSKGLNVDKNKMFIIHNGVEKRFAEANSKLWIEKYGFKDFVLHVGHLGSVRKNSLNIIKAMQKSGLKSVIIANVLNNKNGNQCRAEIEKSANISLIEWLNHDSLLLESAYAACKTFILPTRYETPGRAALEAGLAGANIVITPYGGTREYFRNYVDYADPYSINDIKAKIEKSYNQPKNDNLKKHIHANFLWEKIAKETLKIYQRVL